MKYGNTTSEGCTQEEFDEILEFACTDKLPPFSQLVFYPAWSSSDRAWFSAKIKSIPYCTPGKTPPPHPLPIGRTSGTASPLPGKSSATYKYDFYKMYPEN